MVAVDVVLCFLSPVGVERATTWTWDLDVRCIAGRFGEDSLELLHHWGAPALLALASEIGRPGGCMHQLSHHPTFLPGGQIYPFGHHLKHISALKASKNCRMSSLVAVVDVTGVEVFAVYPYRCSESLF